MRKLWPLLMLVGAATSHAAVVGEWSVSFLRGTTVLDASKGATEAAAWAACLARIPQTSTAKQTYSCQNARYLATVTAAPPPPVCTIPQPPVESRPGVCPGATAGNWQQVRNYTAVAHPMCWTPGAWLPAIPPPGVCVAIPPPVTSSVTLSWTPPTQNTNGSPLANLASYKLYYGKTATALNQTKTISKGLNAYVLDGLTAGQWFVVITAVNSAGRESVFSNTAMATVP